jgi:hypothetical protein
MTAAVFLAGCAIFRTAPPPATPLEEVKKQIHLKGPALLSAGFSKVEITPAVGTPLAGYAKRKGKPSVGIRDPLYARVLALSDGEDTIVLISSDLLIFPQPLAERILEKLSSQLKVPRSSLFLMATHTHSGSGSIGHGFLHERVFGPYRSQVVEGIVGRIAWAAQQAIEHKQPVHFGIRQGSLSDLTENRMVPGGAVDPTVQVFFMESQQGAPLGVLVNCAAHPTLLEARDLRFSADYPGRLAQVIESQLPGAVCLFANAAAGDVRPKDLLGANPEERVHRFGDALAEVSLGLINQMEFSRDGDLASWGWWVALPVPQLRLGWIPLHPWIGRQMRPSPAYLNLFAIGKAIVVPLPAELTTELGLELRAKLLAHSLIPFLLGYANGYLGYAVTPEQYRLKSYESWMTWYGPAFGVSFVEEVLLLASAYSPKEK